MGTQFDEALLREETCGDPGLRYDAYPGAGVLQFLGTSDQSNLKDDVNDTRMASDYTSWVDRASQSEAVRKEEELGKQYCNPIGGRLDIQ
ncbi:unnamed protein product [Echinostoma caproni]|uniref:Lipoprotein n=1 Tax=Echinostoma caproni TaxID=27848 RepID=A0A183APJ5_9TREM|nr:unnamed protein product [Echinostoma caproni]